MADKDTPSSVLIDDSSIAPSAANINHVRQNSLEKHIQNRPDMQELKDRHILLDTNAAPALQAAAYDLEKALATDSLKKGLEKRSQRDDLVGRNILPTSTAAPAIQGQARELEKHMRADSLNEKIAHRPNPADLVKGGVLHEDPTAISEEQKANDKLYEERMEEEYAKREGGA